MRILKLLVVLLLVSSVLFAQRTERVSVVQELQLKLSDGITAEGLNAVLEAGRSGNREYVPYLKKLASRNKDPLAVRSVESYAGIALAILGEEPYVSQIIEQIDDSNFLAQDVGIQKIGLVGGRPAFKALIRLLDDTTYRVEVPTAAHIAFARQHGYGLRIGDEALVPRSFLAMKILAGLVPNPPVAPEIEPNIEHVVVWKCWIEKNAHLIQ